VESFNIIHAISGLKVKICMIHKYDQPLLNAGILFFNIFRLYRKIHLRPSISCKYVEKNFCIIFILFSLVSQEEAILGVFPHLYIFTEFVHFWWNLHDFQLDFLVSQSSLLFRCLGNSTFVVWQGLQSSNLHMPDWSERNLCWYGAIFPAQSQKSPRNCPKCTKAAKWPNCAPVVLFRLKHKQLFLKHGLIFH